MNRPQPVIACLALGSVLMLVFEDTVPRLLGMGLLFAFIVGGVFLVANPEDLGRPEDDERPS